MDEQSAMNLGDEPRRSIRWYQVLFPVIVLLILFFVVLPRFVDYQAVWASIRSLDSSAVLLLIAMGLISSWLEASVYTSLIPSLGYLKGWKAFLGGNTIAGFAPAPWDILVRYAMYRGFGVDGNIAGASVVVGGGFMIAAALLAPLLVLVVLVISGWGADTAQTIVVLAVAAAIGVVALIVVVLRRENAAAAVGRRLQQVGDWVASKVDRAAPGGIEDRVVAFRTLVVDALKDSWRISIAFVGAMHVVRYFGMLFLFRQMGIGPDQVSGLELLAVYAIGLLVGLLPIVPAGLGVVELAYVWILARDDPQLADLVAAATFAHRAFFWLLPIIIGIVPLVGWIRGGGFSKPQKLDPAPPEGTAASS